MEMPVTIRLLNERLTEVMNNVKHYSEALETRRRGVAEFESYVAQYQGEAKELAAAIEALKKLGPTPSAPPPCDGKSGALWLAEQEPPPATFGYCADCSAYYPLTEQHLCPFPSTV